MDSEAEATGAGVSRSEGELMVFLLREQLREEDGVRLEHLDDDGLGLVFASGPVPPGMSATAAWLDAALAGHRLGEPESALALIHDVAVEERLLAAAAIRWRANQLVIAWVGDVRGHLLRGDQPLAHTREHTLGRALGVVPGAGGAAERVVVRILGGPDHRAEVERWSTEPGDRLLLCAPHLHDFRPPASYLRDALDFTRPWPGRLLIHSPGASG